MSDETVAPNTAVDEAAELRRLEVLSHWLDSRFRVPGTNIRFGLDSIVGIVPGVGDGVTLIPASYVVLRAHQLGVPRYLVVRMAFNVVVDVLVGAVPIIGDLFDVAFKANRRNVAILNRHFRSN